MSLNSLIWLNAQEESTLWEFLQDYLAKFPAASEQQAMQSLCQPLFELLNQGKIGVYVEQWAKPETRHNLALEEAAEALQNQETWINSQASVAFYHLYMINDDFIAISG